jgi:hypothetical protein
VKSVLTGIGILLVLVCAALAAGAAGERGLAGVAVAIIAALSLAALATVYRPAGSTTAGRPPLGPRPSARAHDIDRAAAAVRWATVSPRWADTELRPVLRRIADSLFQAQTGYGLAERPVLARKLLGEQLFSFVDPSRAVRGHEDGPAMTLAEIERLLSALEDLT